MGTRNILTVVGAAIGGYVTGGSPQGFQWGAMIGSTIGGIVDPVEIEGARLEDLKATTFEYGSAIPHCYGSPRMPGIVAWASDKQEVATTDDGKGGPETTSYSYKQDVLFLLTSNEIVGVRRVWANGKLVWSAADDATDATLLASAESPAWDELEVFTGAATQLPWSVYEAAVGVGNAPAMRGRGCVAITGLNLGSSGYSPQLTFEIVTDGTVQADNEIGELFIVETTMPGASPQPRVGSLGFTTADKAIQVLQPMYFELRNDIDTTTFGMYETEEDAQAAGKALLPTTQVSPPSDLLGEWGLTLRTVTPASPGGLTYIRFDYDASFLCNDSMVCGTTVFARSEYFLVRYPQPDSLVFTNTTGEFSLSDAESVLSKPEQGTQFALVARGSGDESVVVAKAGQETTPSTTRYMYGRFTSSAYPRGAFWTNADFSLAANWYYTCRGDSIWMMVSDFGARVVRRFAKTGGPALAESADLGYYPASIATDGTTVWVQLSDGIHQLDAETLVAVGALIPYTGWSLPTLGSVPTIHCDSDGNLQAFGIGNVYRWNVGAGTWDLVVSLGVQAVTGIPYDDYFHIPVYTDGKFYLQVDSIDGDTSIMTLYGTPDAQRVTSNPIPLSEVVLDLCERSGLETAYVDVTDLENEYVRAYAVTQVSPARSAIETLMAAYFFSAKEAAQLVFVLRGGAVQESVPFASMGAGVDGAQDEPLMIMRRSDIEIPAQVAVTYANFNNDYQAGTEYSDRLIGPATGVSARQLPLAFQPQEAKRIAEAGLLDGVLMATSIGPVALSREYSHLEPTDVITVYDETGTRFRTRIDKIDESDGVRTMTLMLDDATALSSVALTDESDVGSTVVLALLDTDLILGDWPIFRDADNEAGHYAAFTPESTVGAWPGASLHRGLDNTGYSEQLRTTDSTVAGITTTALGDWTGGTVFDEMNSVTVQVVGTLSNYTRDQILNGTAPLYMIGDEAIYARTAALVSAGIYTLSGLLRGRRGTEWAMSTHLAGDEVVRVSTTGGVRRVAMESGQLGTEFSFKAPTFGRSVAGATEHLFTNSGVGLKPFAPVDLRAARDPSTEDVALTWKRRTRLSCRFTGTACINVPLGESTEEYSVEICTTDSPQTLLRTVSTTSASLTYTAAQQYDDGIVIGSPIEVTVYQISSVVGRGYALTEVIS